MVETQFIGGGVEEKKKKKKKRSGQLVEISLIEIAHGKEERALME